MSGRISGSGNINLNGKAIQANYSIAGSGNIQAADLQAENTDASISGSGNISCYAIKNWLPASKEAAILPIKEILKKWMLQEKIYGRSNKDNLQF